MVLTQALGEDGSSHNKAREAVWNSLEAAISSFLNTSKTPKLIDCYDSRLQYGVRLLVFNSSLASLQPCLVPVKLRLQPSHLLFH